ncbi:GerMN domain-containing protein [Rothia sp. AR01]|uniref:GerMN domain-containing protein n=1 Tax=Rothia santali TaxID=2949643 RepID=A0A9X2HAI9_9MICC|nr:GerMN domain-containing protein [Rothia santali]MCP3424620.1 GerMN domain-containing protein [Rothia santali]
MAPRFARPAAIACVALLAVSGCSLLDGPEEDPSGSLRDSSSSLSVPLYWIGQPGPSPHLFREYVPLAPDETTAPGDVVAIAVSMMSRMRPADPDYENPWSPASSVGSSVSSDGTLTLDVSSDMFPEDLDADAARMALQQLIYTATATASSANVLGPDGTGSVVVLVDGRAGHSFAGKTLGSPMGRDDGARAPLWVIDPAFGQVHSREVGFKLVAERVAATVHWRLSDADGTIEEQVVDLHDDGSGPHEIQFDRVLEPGDYTIEAFVPNEDVYEERLVDPSEPVSIWDDHDFTVSDGDVDVPTPQDA